MRNRTLFTGWLLFLLALALPCFALADAFAFGETVYVFPKDNPAQPTLTLSVRLTALDPKTLEAVALPPLPGAVFGIYMKGEGGFIPFPDPTKPSSPLTLSLQGASVEVCLPLSIDLYIKQESISEGFMLDEKVAEYRLLNLPETVEYENRKAGQQGVSISLSGNTGAGSTPLAGIPFSLIGAGDTVMLTTGADGTTTLLNITPGEYTLRQLAAPVGYSIDRPEIPVTVTLGGITRVDVTNSLNGTLAVRTLGAALGADLQTRFVPVSRQYEVFAADGSSMGLLSHGETLSLPASVQGTRYTLRAVKAPDDGFSTDETTWEGTVFPGITTECQTVVASEKGLFTLEHRSKADQASVSGGLFSLLNEAGQTVMTFSADDDGRFAPETPLPKGRYELSMEHAAEGFQYVEAAVSFTIEPYLSAGQPVAKVVFESDPVPPEIKAPSVTANVPLLTSLFEADANILVSLALFAEGPPLPVELIEITLDEPSEPGVSKVEGGLFAAKRFPLPGVPEILSLSVSGTARYRYSYYVSKDEQRTEEVEARFTAQVASFKPLSKRPTFAVSGFVRDEQLEPVIGLRVTQESAPGVILDETFTDVFGAYGFEKRVEDTVLQFYPTEGFGVLIEGNDARVLPKKSLAGRVVPHGLTGPVPLMLSIGTLVPKAPAADGTFTFKGIILEGDHLAIQAPDGILYRIEEAEGETLVHLYPAASVTGIISDPYDIPVPGAGILLSGEGLSLEAATDAEGLYSFENLFPGEYRLAFTPPEGQVVNGETSRDLAIEAGEQRLSEDAEMMRPASIIGHIEEEGAPLAGIPVKLLSTGDTAITGTDGSFSFEKLSAGSYSLSFALPDGMVLEESTQTITLSLPDERIELFLRAARLASIEGRVWSDANDDGLLSAGEGGLEGVMVALLSQYGTEIISIQTAQDGVFAFKGLSPGSYRVAVTLPDGLIFTRTAPDVSRMIDSVDGRSGVSEIIMLASGESKRDLLCGGTVSGRIGGTVLTEQGLPIEGARVALEREAMAPLETVSDTDGRYAFEALRAGDYTLTVTLPNGYWLVEPRLDSASTKKSLQVRSWRASQTVDFVGQKTGSLSAHIWLDAEAYGVEGGQPGIAGATVSLYSTTGTGSTPLREAQTDAGGNVSLPSLRPGEYRLVVSLPGDAWGFTLEAPQTVRIGEGETASVSAGATELGVVFGRIFADENYDGLRGTSEEGIAASVTLLDGNLAPVAETSTRGDGQFRFEGLKTGEYALRFDLPEGYCFTRARADAPSFNSDVPESKTNSAATAMMYLPMGESLSADAGAYQAASVSGKLWTDDQNNGLFQTGSPLPGITVSLRRDGASTEELTSGADGAFAFDLLPPGSYEIKVALPESMRVTAGTGLTFTLSMNERKADVRLGAVYVGSVEGRVINEDSGEGLSDVRAVIAPKGAAPTETVTGADGVFRFDALLPGSAEVSIDVPEGYILEGDGTASQTIEVPQRDTASVEAFRLMPEGIVQGVLWVDRTENRRHDEGEVAVQNATITLNLSTDDPSAPGQMISTDENGAFRFEKLKPATYRLKVEPPEGTLLYDSQSDLEITLGMGEINAMALPSFIAASISGVIYEDMNNDQARGSTEPSIPGIVILAVDAEGNTVAEATSDLLGAYLFDGLRPGAYTLRYTTRSSYLQSHSDQQDAPISLSMSDSIADHHIGLLRSARVGDIVWLDENGNGLQDTAEPGVSGLSVTLWLAMPDDTLEKVAEAVTDANGRYRFDDIYPDSYVLSVDLGEAYLPTQRVEGLPEINSKLLFAKAESAMTPAFQVLSGARLLTVDLGLVIPELAAKLGWVIESDGVIQVPEK